MRLQGRATDRLTLKCRIFPGGWLPTMWPQMAATPGSLKVVHSFALLPASQDKLWVTELPFRWKCSARQTPDRCNHCDKEADKRNHRSWIVTALCSSTYS